MIHTAKDKRLRMSKNLLNRPGKTRVNSVLSVFNFARRHSDRANYGAEFADEIGELNENALDSEIARLLDEDKAKSIDPDELNEVYLDRVVTVFDRDRRTIEEAAGAAINETVPDKPIKEIIPTKPHDKQIAAIIAISALIIVSLAAGLYLRHISLTNQHGLYAEQDSETSGHSDSDATADEIVMMEVSSLYLNEPFSILSAGALSIESGEFSKNGVNLQLSLPIDGPARISEITRFILYYKSVPLVPIFPLKGLYPWETEVTEEEVKSNKREVYPSLVEFPEENLVLAGLKFQGMRDLDGRVTLRVKNLAQWIKADMKLDANRLFSFKETGEQVLQLDGLNLVLEGMDYNGDNIVLVMHGEDPVTGERTRIIADMRLTVQTIDGEEITIPGNVRSSKQGADVRFMLRGNIIDMMLAPEDLGLRLIGVQTIMPDIDLVIKLADLDIERAPAIQNARDQLKSMFGAMVTDLLYIDEDRLFATVIEQGENSVKVHKINALRTGGDWVAQTNEIL
ncbi:MAG: hypothetical protein LBQ68_10545 [Clostridiales bacterium]|jgi:hypothetical protein|nr:hypothetical protein [Clostridiales bacterium]